MGIGIFQNCYSLVELTIPFVGTTRGNTDVNEAVFNYMFYNSSSNSYTYYADNYQYTDAYLPLSLRTINITSETKLGRRSLEDLYYVENINLSNNIPSNPLTRFEYAAFADCFRLKDIYIPDTVTFIGGDCFWRCYEFKDVVVPNSVTSFGAYPFAWCNGIETLTIPFVGASRGATGGDALFNYMFQRGYNSTCYAAWTQTLNNGTSKTYPACYTVNQYYNFNYKTTVTNLQTLSIHNGDSITEQLITCSPTYSSYATGYIPSSIKKVVVTDATAIRNGAFSSLSYLVEIELRNDNDRLTLIDNAAFYGLSFNAADVTIEIPDSVTEIGSLVTYGSKVTKLVLPKSLQTVLSYSFFNSDYLEEVEINGNNTGSAVRTALGEHMFEDCDKLERVTINGIIDTIPAYAFFNCPKLKYFNAEAGEENVIRILETSDYYLITRDEVRLRPSSATSSYYEKINDEYVVTVKTDEEIQADDVNTYYVVSSYVPTSVGNVAFEPNKYYTRNEDGIYVLASTYDSNEKYYDITGIKASVGEYEFALGEYYTRDNQGKYTIAREFDSNETYYTVSPAKIDTLIINHFEPNTYYYKDQDDKLVIATEYDETEEYFTVSGSVVSVSDDAFVANTYYYLDGGKYQLATEYDPEETYYSLQAQTVSVGTNVYEANTYYIKDTNASYVISEAEYDPNTTYYTITPNDLEIMYLGLHQFEPNTYYTLDNGVYVKAVNYNHTKTYYTLTATEVEFYSYNNGTYTKETSYEGGSYYELVEAEEVFAGASKFLPNTYYTYDS